MAKKIEPLIDIAILILVLMMIVPDGANILTTSRESVEDTNTSISQNDNDFPYEGNLERTIQKGRRSTQERKSTILQDWILTPPLTQLTFGDFHQKDPSFSPDGTKIVYSSKEDGGDYYDIWMMDANGNNPVQITDNSYNEEYPSFNSNGSWIVYHQDSWGRTDLDINIIDFNGTILYYIGEPSYDYYPRFSNDGNYIVYSKGYFLREDIYLFDLINKKDIRVTYNSSRKLHPCFSSDDSKIVFQSFELDKDGFGIHMVEKNDDAWDNISYTILMGGESNNQHPIFYGGDKYILFSSNENDKMDKYNIFSYDILSRLKRKVTNNRYSMSLSDFNEISILYYSDKDNYYNIFSAPFSTVKKASNEAMPDIFWRHYYQIGKSGKEYLFGEAQSSTRIQDYGTFHYFNIMYSDFNKEIKLTNGNYWDDCPTFSPTGKYIIFDREYPDNPSVNYLYLLKNKADSWFDDNYIEINLTLTNVAYRWAYMNSNETKIFFIDSNHKSISYIQRNGTEWSDNYLGPYSIYTSEDTILTIDISHDDNYLIFGSRNSTGYYSKLLLIGNGTYNVDGFVLYNIHSPRFNNDSTMICFINEELGFFRGIGVLWRNETDWDLNYKLIQKINFASLYPQFMNDGKNIFFFQREADNVHYPRIINYITQETEKIFYKYRSFEQPIKVPNKNEFIVCSGLDIILYNVSTNEIIPLDNSIFSEGSPNISPDGRYIVYIKQNDSKSIEDYDIYKLDLTTRSKEVLYSTPYNDLHPSISPDGTLMVFSTKSISKGKYDDICVMDLKTKNVTRITKEKFSQCLPRFSLDGNYIVYCSSEDGGGIYDIWTLEKRYGAWNEFAIHRQITSSIDMDLYPIFVSDKNLIFYHAYNSVTWGEQNIFSVNPDGTNKVKITLSASDDVYPYFDHSTNIMYFSSSREGNLRLYQIDFDEDDDSYLAFEDMFQNDPTEWWDNDLDGIGDNADTDDDNDLAGPDGIADTLDDGPGRLDIDDAFPLDPTEWVDSDCDGVGDNTDDFPYDPNQWIDSDGDGVGDYGLDGAPGIIGVDDDGNSIIDDESELGWPGTDDDAFPENPLEQCDNDHDGIGNNADMDDDNDGFPDGTDAFPFNPSCAVDADDDGMPDVLLEVSHLLWFNVSNILEENHDDDNDGFNDTVDTFPLNPAEWNDNDGDRIGDNADTDDDNDGISDENEKLAGTNPLDNKSIPKDVDGNGIPDYLDIDIDGDGYNNDLELSQGTDPLNSSDYPEDLDKDFIPDSIDTDDDNDGYPDIMDTFPLNPSGAIDTDNDGKPDFLLNTSIHSWFDFSETLTEDFDDDNDETPDSKDAFPLNPKESKDTDGDGIGDNADEDADGDGLKKIEKIFFFFDYSDTDDSNPNKGWLVGRVIPLSTVISFFKILGGVFLIWMIGVIFRKVRFIKFDKKLSGAKSIEELDRWYHNQIKLAIEHGKVDYIASRHLKAYYEAQKKRLTSGKQKKRTGRDRVKRAFFFTKNDFFELLDMEIGDDTTEEIDKYADDKAVPSIEKEIKDIVIPEKSVKAGEDTLPPSSGPMLGEKLQLDEILKKIKPKQTPLALPSVPPPPPEPGTPQQPSKDQHLDQVP